MRAAKVQASLRIRAVSPEPPLLAHASSESRGTIRQKAISLVPLNGWACAVKICHDGMLEDTISLDGAHFLSVIMFMFCVMNPMKELTKSSAATKSLVLISLLISLCTTKQTKLPVHQVKTQISLGIHPVWSVSSLHAQWVAKDAVSSCGLQRLWSDWADAQADLSLSLALMQFYWFYHAAAQIFLNFSSPFLTHCREKILIAHQQSLSTWV